MNTFFKCLKLCLVLSTMVYANGMMGFSRTPVECPDQFAGIVKKVLHPGPLINGGDWVEIHFEVIEKMKGDVSDDPVIRILKYGPFNFQVGQEYIVSLRNGFLCGAKLEN